MGKDADLGLCPCILLSLSSVSTGVSIQNPLCPTVGHNDKGRPGGPGVDQSRGLGKFRDPGPPKHKCSAVLLSTHLWKHILIP